MRGRVTNGWYVRLRWLAGLGADDQRFGRGIARVKAHY